MMWISTNTVLADAIGGIEPNPPGGTQVIAGVVVDYMAKVRFEVKEKVPPHDPIPGASIEIYVPSLSRYVLYGVTDSEGALEVNIIDESKQPDYQPPGTRPPNIGFSDITRTEGSLSFSRYLMLYLPNNTLTYKVYKSSYEPYPAYEQKKVNLDEIPTVYVTYLFKFRQRDPNDPVDIGDSSNGNGSGSVKGGNSTKVTEENIIETTPSVDPIDDGVGIDTLPKTGVKGYMNMWLTGAMLLALAMGIIIFLMKKDRDKRKEQ